MVHIALLFYIQAQMLCQLSEYLSNVMQHSLYAYLSNVMQHSLYEYLSNEMQHSLYEYLSNVMQHSLYEYLSNVVHRKADILFCFGNICFYSQNKVVPVGSINFILGYVRPKYKAVCHDNEISLHDASLKKGP